MSDIPWDGPTACAGVGYIDDEYVLNPTLEQLESESQLELTVATTRDAVLMVEASANELSEDVMVGAIEFAQEQLNPVVQLIEQIRSEVGQEKREFVPAADVDEDTV